MELEGIVVIAGIVLQSFVYRSNKLVSAIIGFATAAFALVCGVLGYLNGEAVQFFGVKLPEVAFILACAAWLALDAYLLLKALKTRKKATVSTKTAE